MADNFIVMADVVASRKADGSRLMDGFRGLVAQCNADLADCILSPYTITLGDEFQGIAGSLHCATKTLFYLEEVIVRESLDFRLRYVVHRGQVDTMVNRSSAYEMLGPGLTRARELLSDKRRERPRFLFDLPEHCIATNLNRLFRVVASLLDDWKARDAHIITELLTSDSDREISKRLHKDRSLVWRRRKSLRIDDYKALRELALDLTEEWA